MKHFLFGLVLVACGGAEGTPLLEGGAGDDATAGDAQNDARPDAGKDANCQALFDDLEQKRQAAVQCCLTCGTLQCTQQIEGLCCPLTVTSGDSLASKAYDNALQAVKNANCPIGCPAITCSTKPSDVCQATGSCLQ